MVWETHRMADALQVNKQSILQLIFRTIDEINETLPDDRHLEKSSETQLLGRQGKLDSLGLVSFIILLEQHITEELNTAITLADEKAISRTKSPFRTVESLADYVLELLQETA
jgi:acyl carrier protein